MAGSLAEAWQYVCSIMDLGFWQTGSWHPRMLGWQWMSLFISERIETEKNHLVIVINEADKKTKTHHKTKKNPKPTKNPTAIYLESSLFGNRFPNSEMVLFASQII